MAIPYVSDNIFAKILTGDIPSYKIFETEHVLAVLDAFPCVPGHALLLPKGPAFTHVCLSSFVCSLLYKLCIQKNKKQNSAGGDRDGHVS